MSNTKDNQAGERTQNLIAKYGNIELCQLPDAEFRLGGDFDGLARGAGHASGKSAANEHNAWNQKLSEAIAAL